MIAPTQIRKPLNWQDFEKLCKKLWGEIWECSDTIQCNGRSGQKQCGVDVYGKPKSENGYYGIQCKGKDDYTKSQLTQAEIDTELEKAEKFVPNLKRFIFATTTNKDAQIEEYIRIKNIENIGKGLFEVYISSWEDIVHLLEERRSTFNWYINNCQYKDLSDIEVSFNGKTECEIEPVYTKTITKYYLKIDLPINPLFEKIMASQKRILEATAPMKPFRNYLEPPTKTDYTWCTVKFLVRNSGSTVIEDYKIYIIFEAEKIERVDDKFRYAQGLFLDHAVRAQINSSRESKREVFESTEFFNIIEYIPKNSVLVQKDYKLFKVGLKPLQNTDAIKVKWIMRSRDFEKFGELKILVKPKFEEHTVNIEVEKQEDLKDTQIVIKPKIVEE